MSLSAVSFDSAILEHVVVKHKTSSLPLSQLAQITVKDSQTLIVLVNDDSVSWLLLKNFIGVVEC